MNSHAMNPHAVSDDRLQEIAAPYGGVAALNERMARFNRAVALLGRDWHTLMAEHPDRWIAVGPDGVLAVAATRQDLLAELRDKGVPPGEFVVQFLDTTPAVLII